MKYMILLLLMAGLPLFSADENGEEPPVEAVSIERLTFQPFPRTGKETVLDEQLISLLEEYQVAGVSAAFVRGEELLWTGSYGWFDLEKNTSLQENHCIRIASISKSFVCLAAMQLAAEGKLDLDEDINTYLESTKVFIRHPEYPDIPITVRQLMNHTSAVANGNYVPFVTAARSEDPPPTLDDYFGKDGRFNEPIIWSNFAPGEEFEYSNMATIILAAVIENLSGRLFADYVDSVVFSPLEMNGSSFHINEHNIGVIADMYRRQDTDPVHFTKTVLTPLPEWGKYVPGTHGGLHSPQGGMISNALDLSRFAVMMMNNGKIGSAQIFSPEILERMHEISVETDKGGAATFGRIYKKKGLGIHITDELLEGFTLYGHTGGAYGIITNLFYTRDQDPNFGFIFLINGANTGVNGLRSPFSRIEEDLARLLYQHFMIPPVGCGNIDEK